MTSGARCHRVAVIGTGTMGAAMATRLLGAGIDVDVWSRHAASTLPLVAGGATSHDEASDAVAHADVVITMLPTAQITADVMIGQGVLGAMPSGSTWVQMATIGAEAAEHLTTETRTRRPGISFVDAPVSVQSARELYERQVHTEAAEIRSVPDEEQEELTLIYEAKGLPPAEAEQVAARLMANEQEALDAMTREELGLDPSTLGGSPYSAGASSLALFALGVVVPLVPFFFASGTVAVVGSIAAAAAGLFAIGALIPLLTGRGPVFSGTRQLVFGLLAAGLTFGLGHLIGLAIT